MPITVQGGGTVTGGGLSRSSGGNRNAWLDKQKEDQRFQRALSLQAQSHLLGLQRDEASFGRQMEGAAATNQFRVDAAALANQQKVDAATTAFDRAGELQGSGAKLARRQSRLDASEGLQVTAENRAEEIQREFAEGSYTPDGQGKINELLAVLEGIRNDPKLNAKQREQALNQWIGKVAGAGLQYQAAGQPRAQEQLDESTVMSPGGVPMYRDDAGNLHEFPELPPAALPATAGEYYSPHGGGNLDADFKAEEARINEERRIATVTFVDGKATAGGAFTPATADDVYKGLASNYEARRAFVGGGPAPSAAAGAPAPMPPAGGGTPAAPTPVAPVPVVAPSRSVGRAATAGQTLQHDVAMAMTEMREADEAMQQQHGPPAGSLGFGGSPGGSKSGATKKAETVRKQAAMKLEKAEKAQAEYQTTPEWAGEVATNLDQYSPEDQQKARAILEAKRRVK